MIRLTVEVFAKEGEQFYKVGYAAEAGLNFKINWRHFSAVPRLSGPPLGIAADALPSVDQLRRLSADQELEQLAPTELFRRSEVATRHRTAEPRSAGGRQVQSRLHAASEGNRLHIGSN